VKKKYFGREVRKFFGREQNRRIFSVEEPKDAKEPNSEKED
jgi:hypothetical protein